MFHFHLNKKGEKNMKYNTKFVVELGDIWDMGGKQEFSNDDIVKVEAYDKEYIGRVIDVDMSTLTLDLSTNYNASLKVIRYRDIVSIDKLIDEV